MDVNYLWQLTTFIARADCVDLELDDDAHVITELPVFIAGFQHVWIGFYVFLWVFFDPFMPGEEVEPNGWAKRNQLKLKTKRRKVKTISLDGSAEAQYYF